MDIVPDTKDWTWVLLRPCPECGFNAQAVRRDAIPDIIRQTADALGSALGGTRDPRQRSSPQTWSPLEYACHVRDVFRLYDARLELMLTQEDPLYPNWDQDATAVADRYGEQDPTRVSGELREAADRLAAHFEQVKDHEWERRGRRSDGASFTVESFARYLAHDPVHHVRDVTGRRWDER